MFNKIKNSDDSIKEENDIDALLDSMFQMFTNLADTVVENNSLLLDLKRQLTEKQETTDDITDDTENIPEDCILQQEENFNNVRPCNNYVIEAINTSFSAQRLFESLSTLLKKKEMNPQTDISVRILLHGISGGGKTAYVEWLSKEMNIPLHYLRFSDVVEANVGETEKNIRDAFIEAREEKAILFIDECDSLIMDRSCCRNPWEISQVNEFLIQIERYPGILFCATNYAERLDSATDRRFHFKIEFFPCTKLQIVYLITNYFPEYFFREKHIDLIYNSGNVVPGDFSTVAGRLRFVFDEEITPDFITSELCDVIKSKKDNKNANCIGFTA